MTPLMVCENREVSNDNIDKFELLEFFYPPHFQLKFKTHKRIALEKASIYTLLYHCYRTVTIIILISLGKCLVS